MRPMLIQRLVEPDPRSATRPIGEGCDLSEDRWRSILRCFDFDHMGAANFENGLVPRTLSRIFTRSAVRGLEAWAFTIMPNDIGTPRWRLERRGSQVPKRAREVFVLSPRDYERSMVRDAIKAVARGDLVLRCPSFMDETLDSDPEKMRDRPIVGWMDMESDMVWFASRKTWEGFAALLGVRVHAPVC